MGGKIKKHLSDVDRDEGKKPAHRLLAVMIALGVVLGALALLAGSGLWYYNDRALPNVMVAGASVGQKTRDQLRPIIDSQAKAMSVTFVNGQARTTVPAKELGVWVDTEATLNHILQARKTDGILPSLAVWNEATVPLAINNDAGMLKNYVTKAFAAAFVDAKDAHLAYNDATSQFDVVPSENGRGLDIKSFEHAVPDLVRHPRNVTLALSTLPTQPLIPTSAAEKAQADANARLKLPLQFTLFGNTIYTAQPADIALWMHFIPDPTKGTITIEYDKAKIRQFLDQKVAASVAAPPVDRKVIVDTTNNSQYVVQQGSTGKQIQDVDALADQVVSAVTTNQPLNKEVAIVEAPFKTITIASSDKWIEVDLGQQRVTMYAGNAAVQSFLISSGTAAHPTVPGEYHVWYKTPSQTMTERSNVTSGDYFYLPNVKWVSYFDGDRAFHGTYWHHNFGHPMSHGCINMTEADAKILYDFAPVGTRVVVHA